MSWSVVVKLQQNNGNASDVTATFTDPADPTDRRDAERRIGP